MKGPTLVYDLRVLRVFRCSACGREVPMPGSTTSQLCTCSDPPRFMTAVDRPKTPIPDTTAFQSPADPADVEEPEEEISEENYVPFIPQIPVRPPQFPQRRKLSEDIQKFEFRENGDQLEVQPLTPSGSGESGVSENREGGHRGNSRRGHSNRSDSRPNSDSPPRGRHDGPRRQRDDWRRGRDNSPAPSEESATDGNAATAPAEAQGRHRDRDRDSDRGRSSNRDRNRDRRSRHPNSGQNFEAAIAQDPAPDGATTGSANESPASQTDSPRHGRGDRNRPPRRPAPAADSSAPSQEFGDGVDEELLSGSLSNDELDSDDGAEGDDTESADGGSATGAERGRRRPRRRGRRRGRGRGPAGNEAPPAAE